MHPRILHAITGKPCLGSSCVLVPRVTFATINRGHVNVRRCAAQMRPFRNRTVNEGTLLQSRILARDARQTPRACLGV
jgi:hypothetical protein